MYVTGASGCILPDVWWRLADEVMAASLDIWMYSACIVIHRDIIFIVYEGMKEGVRYRRAQPMQSGIPACDEGAVDAGRMVTGV